MKNSSGTIYVRSSLDHGKKVVIDAARIRRAIFVDELGLLDVGENGGDIELDPYDHLETTIHFVAYLIDPSTGASEPMGASRLLAPNEAVARKLGTTLGLAMEASYDLRRLPTQNIRPAEVSRLGVLKENRGSRAFMAIHDEMLAVSLRLGWTHWLAAASMITDCEVETEMILEFLNELEFMHRDVRVEPRGPADPPIDPRRRIYSEDQRRRYRSGEREAIRLPDTLSLFIRCNARAISAPLYDEKFRVFSIGIMIALSEAERLEARSRRGTRGER